MENELLIRSATSEDALPTGEASPAAAAIPVVPAPTPAPAAPVVNEQAPAASLRSEAPAAFGNEPMVKSPSPKQQSWGALISIVLIVLMVVVGAFYAWGERIASERLYPTVEAQ